MVLPDSSKQSLSQPFFSVPVGDGHGAPGLPPGGFTAIRVEGRIRASNAVSDDVRDKLRFMGSLD